MVSLTTDSDTALPIANAIGVESVVSLEAKLGISGWNARGVKISGVIDAVIDQRCIVTLEPMQNTLSESFLQHFLPEVDSRDAVS